VKVGPNVQQAYDAGIADLNTQYAASLDRALGTAQTWVLKDNNLRVGFESIKYWAEFSLQFDRNGAHP
jgi:hypothetical protein